MRKLADRQKTKQPRVSSSTLWAPWTTAPAKYADPDAGSFLSLLATHRPLWGNTDIPARIIDL
jgi:hypothetical protein